MTSYNLHILWITQMDSGSVGGRLHTSVKTRKWGSLAPSQSWNMARVQLILPFFPCRLTHLNFVHSAKPPSPAYYTILTPSPPSPWILLQRDTDDYLLGLDIFLRLQTCIFTFFVCMPSTKCHSPYRSFCSLRGGTTIIPIMPPRDQGPHWTPPSITPSTPLGCPLLWPCPSFFHCDANRTHQPWLHPEIEF